MNILVTGATGFIGRALVKSLLAAEHQVTALSRDPRRAAAALPARCRHAGWNPHEGIPTGLLDGIDAVVHLAGAGVADQRWTADRKREIIESRVEGTRAVVDAIRARPADARPSVLVAASAIGIYGDRGDEVLDESSAPGNGFLAEVCTAWEHESREAESLGVRVAMLRVGIVLGPDGGALAAMLPLFRLGVAGPLGSGQQWMSWIHRTDVVRLIEFALSEAQATGPINAVAPEPVTNREFTSVLAAALHRPAILPAPGFALRLAMGELSTLVLNGQRVKPAAAERLGFRHTYSQLSTALKDVVADDAEVIEQEQWLPRPPSEVFPFFADARNLETLTPDFLNFRIVSMQPDHIAAGTLINYRLRLHGLPMSWQSRIEEWEPGRRFVDVQLHGPYSLWHHTHEFEPHDGGTIVRDRVRYRLPAGTLGGLVAGPFVRKDVAKIFDFRRRKLDELFPVLT